MLSKLENIVERICLNQVLNGGISGWICLFIIVQIVQRVGLICSFTYARSQQIGSYSSLLKNMCAEELRNCTIQCDSPYYVVLSD